MIVNFEVTLKNGISNIITFLYPLIYRVELNLWLLKIIHYYLM